MVSPKSVLINDASPARLAALRRGSELLSGEKTERILDLARHFTKSAVAVFVGCSADTPETTGISTLFTPENVSPRLVDYATKRATQVLERGTLERAEGLSRGGPLEDEHAFIGIPIHSDDGFVIAALGVAQSGPHVWSEAESALVTELAQSLSLQNSTAQRREAAELDLVRSKESLEKALGWAECLVWEADVTCSSDGWDWKFKLYPSGLFHSLFGERVPSQDRGLWYRFNLPDQVEMDARSREAMLSGKPGYRQEFRVVGDNQTTWLRETVIIQRPTPASFHLIGVATDITVERHLEEHLEQARDAAVAASKAKSDFLANMSHEIRTPMNGVLGMTSSLLRTSLTREQEEMLRVVKSSGEDLVRLVDELLDFSRIEAGKLQIEPVAVRVRTIFDELLTLMRPRAVEKNIELVGEFNAVTDLCVLADPLRLRQVLGNLVSNAIKFTSVGRVSVHLSAIPCAGGSHRLKFEVTDSGIGIAPEVRARLFKPFEQGETGTARRYGGTGLGLAISLRLVELMGGKLDCESYPGLGSKFWFDLDLPHATQPCSDAASARPQENTPASAQLARPPSAPSNSSAPAATPLGRKRILVADDNHINQLVARSFLEELGHEVTLVSNGNEALACLRSARFDALLLDCQMPEMDGYTTARMIRSGSAGEQSAAVPIVAVTAYAMPEDRARCLEAGMNDYIAKPLRIEALATKLENTFRPPAARPAPAAAAAAAEPTLEFDRRALLQYKGLSYKGTSVIEQCIKYFIDDVPERIGLLRAAAEKRDGTDLAKEAHTLAGSSVTVGGAEVRRRAITLEKSARAGDWASIPGHLAAVETSVEKLAQTLRNFTV